MWTLKDYKADLETLKVTIKTVKAVLSDASNKKDHKPEVLVYLEELKNALYDADDLLDEFTTISEQKRLRKIEGRNFSKRVRRFFSCYGQVILAYKMSGGSKEIVNKLNTAASNHKKFGFTEDYEGTVRLTREETCSFPAVEIIGRRPDVDYVIKTLLSESANTEQNISFLSVTGIGGVGKTALAQLVFDDERVKNAFPLRLWTCVSDHGHEQMNLKDILAKILESATMKPCTAGSLKQVQQRLRAELAGKRFFLVLDDVWNENCNSWDELAGCLAGGQKGSSVLVTTRSEKTASVLGSGQAYRLEGLTKEDSWNLFKRVAFKDGKAPVDLVEIGQSILQRCASVPLAIRVVGSTLHGQGKPIWELFQQNWLAGVSKNVNEITSALLFSYYDLIPPLRSCFSYCAIFSKAYEIRKDMLIGLWMAQGYILPPLLESSSIDNVAEEYFMALLQRCFFQDVKTDDYGEIVSCKIHDLMHDIAQEVSAKEICKLTSNTFNKSKMVRHVAVGENKFMKKFSTKTSIRTYLQVSQVGGKLLMENILANCPRLRTLDLRGTEFEILSNAIAKLLHLRYLDLSYNVKLQVLPKSISKLHNLQTLNLLGCKGLRVLPDDLSKLVNLRVLDVKDCYLPLCMPHNFGKLTNLQKLDRFGMGSSCPRGKQRFHQMQDLKSLVNLKGSLGIQIGPTKDATYVAKGGAYMSTLEHLNGVEIWYLRHEQQYCERAAYEEALLEDLRPHPNLKHYRLVEYYGGTMPTWAREQKLASFLPKLVKIEFNHCLELEQLPWLGRLRCLKSIELGVMPKLEYLTNDIPGVNSVLGSNGQETSFFPCLEYLFLNDLPKLKGWWPSSQLGLGNAHVPLPCLPQLKGLWIYMCPQMATNLQCPLVEDLRVADANRSLELKVVNEGNRKLSAISPLPSPSQTGTSSFPKQMRLTTGNVELLRSVPSENFQCLVEMRIESDNNLKNFSEVEDLFQSRLSSLRNLEIWRCLKLRSLCGGLEHLTALEKLHIRRAPDLVFNAAPTDAGNDAVPWRSLSQKLRSLKLQDLSQLVHLPEGMQHLTSLESLSIFNCTELKSLPAWLTKLTHLKALEVRRCSTKLKARCDKPTGEDWCNIQRIPSIIIEEIEKSGK